MRLEERIIAKVSKDNMEVYLTLLPPSTAPEETPLLVLEDLQQTLTELGVVYGIDEAYLLRVIAEQTKKYDQILTVAKGDYPIQGADAWIEYCFDPNKEKVPRVLPDGSVDHKNLDFIDNVEAGDVLAILHPAEEGTSGKNVFGLEVVGRAGQNKVLHSGKNTELSAEQNQILAIVSGRVELRDDRVNVQKILEIEGHVDASTGHVLFLGDVIIRGDVVAGYNVTASGSVDVSGNVEASVIRAGVNVIVRNGINGKSNCEIYAGCDVVATFIENAKVVAGGCVMADSLINSQVSCYDSAIISGKRGKIIGGTTRGARIVAAFTVGNPSMVNTFLEVGITPDLKERMEVNQREIELLQKAIDRDQSELEALKKIAQEGKLTIAQKKQLFILSGLHDINEEQLIIREDELFDLNKMLQADELGVVHIKNTIYPNVMITLGNLTMKLMDPWKDLSFCKRNGEIEMIEYAFEG